MKKTLLLLLLTSFVGFAQTLDPTFDTDGIAKINQFSSSPSLAGNKAVIQLSDQSYLVTAKGISNYDLVLTKILPNGMLDTTFGTSGSLILTTNGFNNKGKIVMLPDGKIIICNGSIVYKININGTLDSSFGTSGALDLTSLNSHLNFIDDYIVSNDNKLLIASDYYSNKVTIGVIKLNLDGTIDTTFGTNGLINYSLNPSSNNFPEFPTTILQDSSNKIILTSYTLSNSINVNLYFSKLNSNGTFDTTFGSNGMYVYPNGILNSKVQTMAVTMDNNYLVSFIDNNTSSPSHTLKINSNGGIYTSFGNNGIVNTTGGQYRSMVIQPDGKIVKAGDNNNQFSILRYNADGSLDNSFGTNGVLSTVIDLNSSITSLLLQTDGKLLATGYSHNTQDILTMARYTDLNLGNIDLSSAKNSLLVYPNPIEKEATFQYTLNNDETVSIELVDLQGRVLQNIITNENQSAGLQSVRISLNETIASGNYFLKIASSKGSQSIQIIKK